MTRVNVIGAGTLARSAAIAALLAEHPGVELVFADEAARLPHISLSEFPVNKPHRGKVNTRRDYPGMTAEQRAWNESIDKRNDEKRARRAAAKPTEPTAKTGWPPGMLQDDDRKLSRALAGTPHARAHADEAAQAIREAAQQDDPVAWRYFPSDVYPDVVLTDDPERAELARLHGRTVEALHVHPLMPSADGRRFDSWAASFSLTNNRPATAREAWAAASKKKP